MTCSRTPNFRERNGFIVCQNSLSLQNILTSLLCSIFIFLFVGNCFAALQTFEESKKYREEFKKQAEQYPSSYIKMAYAGIDIILNEKKECEVISISKGAPADIAGIQIGDILKKIDGKTIKNRYQAFKLYDAKSPGDYMSVEVERDGRLIKKRVQLETNYAPYDIYIMTGLICKERPIRLAVIAGTMNFSDPVNQKVYDQYKNVIVSNVINLLEGSLIQTYNPQNNVAIIDRQHTESILNELKFQASGLVSKEFRVKMAEMLGATHLLIINYTWIRGKDAQVYGVLTRKLIEVESGKVLATVLYNVSSDNSKKTIDVPEKQDLIEYYKNVTKLNTLEHEAITAYSSVIGVNYKNDNDVHSTLVKVVIPQYESLYQQLKNISPATVEVKNLHSLYLEGADLQLQGFKLIAKAIEKKDRLLTDQANDNISIGHKKITEYGTCFNDLLKKYNLKIKK